MDHDAFLSEELADDGEEQGCGTPPPGSAETPASTPGRGSVPLHAEDGSYAYFTRKEPAWKQTDISVDEQGRRYQIWSIGMVRNAKPENRNDERVYLDPQPHVLKEVNIPARGWYKSKFEPKGVRARPCESDALLLSPYAGTCSVGCPFCLAGDTLVDTPAGPRRIDSLIPGEIVYGRDWSGPVETSVVAIATHHVARYYRLVTDRAEFRVTGDHPVCVVGRGWVPVEFLQPGDEIETDDLCGVRRRAPLGGAEVLQQLGVSADGAAGGGEGPRRLRPEGAPAVQGLRRHYAQPQPALLRQSGVSEGGEGVALDRPAHDRQDAGGDDPPPFVGDPRADECRDEGAAGQPGEGSPEVAGVAHPNVGAHAEPQDGVLVPALLLPQGRPGGALPVAVGVGDAEVARLQGHPVGVRAADARGRGRDVPAGHPAAGHATLHRGEGLPQGRRGEEAGPVPEGLPDRHLGREEAPEPRGARVLAAEVVQQSLTVHDIQTTCENFYARGHLFHNCYVENGTRGYRGSGVTVVDTTYPDKLRRQVSKMRTATAFYMSSFIDPFMPLEEIYHNTRRTAEVAVDNGLPMFFLTRRVAPPWVFDYLKKNPYSYMQFSLNTPDPEDWKKLSPKAAPLQTQFDQVREFHRQGIYVSIQVNPILAGITTARQIVELIHILAEAGADHLIFKFVEIVTPSRKAVVTQMYNRFEFARAQRFDSLFCEVIGGMYTIAEEYRKRALDIFSKECKKAGVTMALCYEYEYERDANGMIIDSTGVSMGGKYLTADQCHGHRVPVFTRPTTEDEWEEIKGCPPSGCLTCSSQFKQEVPCSNDYLASAPAWTPAAMKLPARLPRGSQKKLPDGTIALNSLKAADVEFAKDENGRLSLNLL